MYTGFWSWYNIILESYNHIEGDYTDRYSLPKHTVHNEMI